ncbi:MAG: 2-amino-4-hydroxy-6-hydroxymethyldihydropteridine diphosphokinase [Candidatus Sulfotelmatobacter sp.]|jgi:2-amino-4-hydroxy-6-hydroxymethyldihydropteridine diphosphokinase
MAKRREEKLGDRTTKKHGNTGISPGIAYLSLGSNVGNREAQLQEAVNRLSAVGRVVAVSSFYETEPVEFTAQPWFLNCAVALETRLTPNELMRALLGIEEQMGRRRVQKKGPRSIDIDILLFDHAVLKSADLTIPHPAMQDRRFVLEPLAEIAPQATHPLLRKTIVDLREALPFGPIVRKVKSK